MQLKTALYVITSFLLVVIFAVPTLGTQDYSEEILYLELANIAAGHPQATCKAPSTVTVISAEEIKDIGARTVLDALQLIPGFVPGKDIQGIPIVSLRGVYSPGSERVLFLLDGVPVNSVLTGGGTLFFADLSVDKIERIEIIRGPGSVLYGSEAFAGVINIILKKEFPDHISYRRGSYDLDEINFSWDKRIKNFSFWFNYSHRDHNSYGLPIKRDRFDAYPVFSQNKFLTRYKKTSDWLRREELYSGFSLNDLTFELFYVNHADGIGYNLSGIPSNHSRFARQKLWLSSFYKKNFSLFSLDSTLNFSYTDFDLFSDFYPAGTELIDPLTKVSYYFPYGLKWRRKVDLYRFRFENKTHYSLGKHHFLSGLVFQYDDLDNPHYYENLIPYPCSSYCFRNIPDLHRISFFSWILPEDRFYYSFYFQDEFSFHDRFFFTLGVRYDNYDDFGDKISFRLAAIFSVLKDLYLKFLYGEGFRAPSFRELYIQSCPVMPRSGNPALDAETMKSYELSLFYTKPKYELGLTFFYQRYEDLISLFQDRFYNYVYYNSPGHSSTFGFEFEFKTFWGLIKNNYLSFSYAYLDHDDVQGFYSVPYNVFSLNFNYYLFPRLSLNYRLFYLDDWAYGIDSYFLSNLVFNYFHPMGEIRFAIYNIWDKKYKYPDFTRFYVDNFLQPGRTFEVKLTWYF